MKIKEKIKVYMAYLKIKFYEQIQYKVAAWAGVATQFAWGFMNIMLYATFLKNGGGQDTMTLAQTCTYIWLQQATHVLFNFYIYDDNIIEGIESGAVSMELIKPLNIYTSWHARTLGQKMAMTILRFFPILLFVLIVPLGEYGMMAPPTIFAGVMFAVTFVLSALLLMTMTMLLYYVVMITLSPRGITSAIRLLLDFLSGLAIPIAFMPNIMIKIIKFTPFYYMQNATFSIYNGFISNKIEIFKIVLLQIIWIAILTFIGRKAFDSRIKKISIQGG